MQVETIGDCYMAATGLIRQDPDHALHAVRFAVAMMAQAEQVLMPDTNKPVSIRIGIHSGRVMVGVLRQ